MTIHVDRVKWHVILCVCVCVCGGGGMVTWQKVNIIVGGLQMPAGRGTKRTDREWVEQLLLFIAEPTEVCAIKKHIALDSWIQYKYTI